MITRESPYRILLEASVLVAVVCLPVWMNPYSASVYEPDRAVVLRSIGLVALLGWGGYLATCRVRRQERRPGARCLTAVDVAALGVLGAATLSTILALEPGMSLWGSHGRGGGWFSLLAQLALYAAARTACVRRSAVERLALAIAIGSIPVVLYGVLPTLGCPTLTGAIPAASGRLASFLGNPVFAGGYLVVAIPTTAWLACALWLNANRVRSCVIASLLLLQLAALFLTGSRGPWLGLAGAITLTGIAALRRFRVRLSRPLAFAGAATCFGACLLMAPVGDLGQSPTRVRVGRQNSIRVRWVAQHALSQRMGATTPIQLPSVGADPHAALRPLVGYGPQTLGLVLGRFLPPEFELWVEQNATIDSSHCEMMDVWCEKGALGLLAYLLLMASLFGMILQRLGLLRTGRQRVMFTALPLLGAALGSALFCRFGAHQAWGLGALAGGLGGVLAYLGATTPTEEPAATALDRIAWLGWAACLAHVIEAQFSVWTVAPTTLFWIIAGVLAGCHARAHDSTLDDRPAPQAAMARVALPAALALLAMLVVNGALISRAITGTDVMGLLRGQLAGPLPWIALLLALYVAALGVARGADRRAWIATGIGTIAFLGIWGLHALVRASWVARTMGATLPPGLAGMLRLQASICAMIRLRLLLPLLGIAGLVLLLRLIQRVREPAPGRATTLWAALLPLALAAVTVQYRLAPAVCADVAAAMGNSAEEQGGHALAEALLKRATAGSLWPEYHLGALHLIYARQAAQARTPELRESLLNQALAVAEAAVDAVPYDATHHLRLGQLHQTWVHLSSTDEARRAHAEQAIASFARALALAPYHDNARVRQARLQLSVLAEEDAALATLRQLVPHNTHTAEACQLLAFTLGNRYARTPRNAPERSAVAQEAADWARQALAAAPAAPQPLKVAQLQQIAALAPAPPPPAAPPEPGRL